MYRSILTLLLLSSPALAGDVAVRITGEVEFNQVNGGVLGGVLAGDTATLTFEVDSSVFVNSPSYPVRGYAIEEDSFQLDFGGGNVLGLQNPFPAGDTPYFSLRNDDPAVDGFLVSTFVDFPGGVPTSQAGLFSQFLNNWYVTYGGSTLSSLDVLDAFGVYDLTGLTVFNWTMDDGPFNAMGLVFSSMEIGPAGPSSYCEPQSGNSVAAAGAVLASTGDFLGASAGFLVTDTPDDFGVLFTGRADGGQLPFGCHQRCVGNSVLRYGPFAASGNTLSATIDMSGAPLNNRVQWWYRDPANLAACGSSFSLSNALVQ